MPLGTAFFLLRSAISGYDLPLLSPDAGGRAPPLNRAAAEGAIRPESLRHPVPSA